MKISLDEIDIRLLGLLQDDATLSNQALAERVYVSPPTCLRRMQRLREAGLIERRVALLGLDAVREHLGQGLLAIVEVSLDKQGAEWLEAFEARAVAQADVQQCYRVSPGPDFVLMVSVLDMTAYLELSTRLFTADANVRNVKTYFSVKRAKFGARIALPQAVRR